MKPRPTALELIVAAREHFAQRVLPTISDPKLKFQTLVATHVLGVVERELAAGTSRRERSTLQRYAALLGEPMPNVADADVEATLDTKQRAVCDAIRAGSFDEDARARALLDALEPVIDDALTLWNPAFLARVRRAT